MSEKDISSVSVENIPRIVPLFVDEVLGEIYLMVCCGFREDALVCEG